MPGQLCKKSPHHGWSETGECQWCEPAPIATTPEQRKVLIEAFGTGANGKLIDGAAQPRCCCGRRTDKLTNGLPDCGYHGQPGSAAHSMLFPPAPMPPSARLCACGKNVPHRHQLSVELFNAPAEGIGKTLQPSTKSMEAPEDEGGYLCPPGTAELLERLERDGIVRGPMITVEIPPFRCGKHDRAYVTGCTTCAGALRRGASPDVIRIEPADLPLAIRPSGQPDCPNHGRGMLAGCCAPVVEHVASSYILAPDRLEPDPAPAPVRVTYVPAREPYGESPFETVRGIVDLLTGPSPIATAPDLHVWASAPWGPALSVVSPEVAAAARHTGHGVQIESWVLALIREPGDVVMLGDDKMVITLVQEDVLTLEKCAASSFLSGGWIVPDVPPNYQPVGCVLPRDLAEKLTAAAPGDGSAEIHAYAPTSLGAFYSILLNSFPDRAAKERLDELRLAKAST